MKVNVLRKAPLAVASLLVSASAFAAVDMDSRVGQLEEQMSQVRFVSPMGTCGASTACARPQIECPTNWYITGDILYWKASAGGTEFAYSDQDPTGTLPVRGRTKDMSFDWDWGFRIGLGYNFCHDCWDVQAQYTWFESGGSSSSSAGNNDTLIPLRGADTIVGGNDNFFFSASAKSQYDFDFESVDLDLGRAYYVSCNLAFRPYFGLKAAWIDLSQNTRYTGGVQSGSNLGLGNNTVSVRDSSDFKGVGPRAGLDSKWNLGGGFSIFGNVAGGLLFGYYDVEHKEKYSLLQETNHIKITGGMNRFSPTVQFQLGLTYEDFFLCDTHHISFGLGFDAQYWWRQNQMIKIDDSAPLKYERYSEDNARSVFEKREK